MKSTNMASVIATVILLVNVVAVVQAEEQIDREAKIVGGSSVSASQYPWIVSIFWRSRRCVDHPHFCTGTLYDGNHNGRAVVLTAAHCYDDYLATIRALNSRGDGNCDYGIGMDVGRDDWNAPGGSAYVTLDFDYARVYPHYDKSTTNHDIALFFATSSVSRRSVRVQTTPNCCNNGVTVTAIGYGADYSGGPPTDTLEQVNVFYQDRQMCSASYSPGRIKPGMICAAAPGRDACQGDSGGPLVLGNDEMAVQIGITSWGGGGCAHPDYPGVYAEVGYYYQWIRDQLR